MSGAAAALRIARRDARRAIGRSLLITLMVALPVTAAVFLDVMLRTVQVDGPEKVPLLLGQSADARIFPGGSGDPVLQRPDDTYGVSATVAQPPPGEQADPLPAVDPRGLLPAGTRVITDASGRVLVRTAEGLARTKLRELDYADPLAGGLITQLSGRAPRSTSEVVVTNTLLDTLGLSVGDELVVTKPQERRLTIVGTVRPNYLESERSLAVSRPGAVLSSSGPDADGLPELLVDTPTPFTWEQVVQLNRRGTSAFARQPVLDPPPRSAIPYYADPSLGSQGGNAGNVAAIALIVGLVVLEVVLLAGAAFAVGTRRQARALGLLAATGGTSRQVRSVVLAQGLVLGGLGGLAGVAIGVAGGLAAVPVIGRVFDTQLPPVDLRPVELLALTLIGLTTGLLAAVLPARTAARQDVVAALSGRRGVVTTRRRYPVVGLVVAALGVALALLGGALSLAGSRSPDGDTSSTLHALMILGGTILTQLGLIVATPAIVGATARLGRFLPLAPRLALRDAARHRGRSAPAVAAILGAVAGAVTLTLFVASLSDHDRREYRPELGDGQTYVTNASYPGQQQLDAAQRIEVISRIAPPDRQLPVRTFSGASDCTDGCTNVSVVAPQANRCPVGNDGYVPGDAVDLDPRCKGRGINSRFSGPPVGTYNDFVALTGVRSDVARDVLARGGMVVLDPLEAKDGKGVLLVERYSQNAQDPPATREVSVPAAFVRTDASYLPGFISPAAAKATGVVTAVEGTVLGYDTPPDDATEQRVRAALADIGDDSYFQVERGYRDSYGPGLLALLVASAIVTLGAAGVATGLAQADARADLATLAAVGATPRVRRVLTAFQAAVIAGLGALLGTASGFVPMIAYLYADDSMRVVIPWLNLVTIALVVPAIAAIMAGLLTRSKLPLARRLAT